MSDFEHFLNLRAKYYAETATPEEQAEYITLYKSGRFANLDQDFTKGGWDTDKPLSPEQQQASDKIYANIRENYILPGKSRSITWTWMAAAAAVVIFAVFGVYKYSVNGEQKQPITQSSIQTFAGPYYVVLPDNSTIQLKAGSTLTYDDATFGKTNRQLQLTGTAFFDVTHNPQLPFQVQSGRIITTVLGTSFNVSEESDMIEVTVVRGKVSVGDNEKAFTTISPNEKITITTRSMTFVTRKVNNTDIELGWKEKNLILDELTMKEAMALVEKRFAVHITIENSALNSCPVSGYFVNDESLTQILDVLCKLKQASYFASGSNVIIHGGEGCD